MKRHGIIVAVVAFVLAINVSGCGGGGAKSETKTQTDIRTTTTGQELMDLKKALDSGAITQKEYERQRKKILKRD